ncbi:NADP-dependent isocitrate dehydrogenase [Vicingaceae bacterium]|nr:NADP-dependent isocitrate dehydrogenase [Vicingaceae bacterium]MDB4060721.1 NADP-dependent isocitrate dehydrogenase [Vicingaceae bacterium]MDC1451997.1 NADP-dependent isocitrate dehydrogenase [Vicingaceae bacterium]
MAQKIIYTKTDEAPALATYSLLPIIKRFTNAVGVEVESRDISLASRVLAIFPEYLEENQKVNDALFELGELAKTAEANIIKLPNISASVPQLFAVIEELQSQGFNIPNYPESAKTDEEKSIKQRYDKIKGSAVNPVLREGNSDRRAPKAVKEFARRNPHSMGEWKSDTKSHVATMGADDFCTNEKSLTFLKADDVKIELHKSNGKVEVLKQSTPLLAGEVIDATFLSKKALVKFLRAQKEDAKAKNVLFSLHMKATMMKVSDPIIFGHAVRVFFDEVFEQFGDDLDRIGANPNDGLGSVIEQLDELDSDKKAAVIAAIDKCMNDGPDMAMVNSSRGITNLHVPSDVIIDASMPAMIRTSGMMWNADGSLHETEAIIPDSSYACIYDETFKFCKEHGAFDPTTMGTVPNVGLMAQKAEEYGSHDKTFEIETDGIVKVINQDGTAVIEHKVEQGDIWRMCQAKDAPIENWVELAVNRARATGWPTIFWLDENRAHDAELIKKVNKYLLNHDIEGLDIQIMSPKEATIFTLARIKKGENAISVTGNVLRDYLTDLFPILELGTSAKMLSIVPLMNGGGLFETGAGGSAPKHVEQFTAENHLRWDSLGEFLALAVSLEHLSEKNNNQNAQVLADCLDQATEQLLLNGKSPSRKVNELDNRGSHFYLALYWAKALAEQDDNEEMKATFMGLAQTLEENEAKIVEELIRAQGVAVDIEGYFHPNEKKVEAAMRPSATLNEIIG